MKALAGTFNQEKALVGAFSVITNLRMELFEALVTNHISVIIKRTKWPGEDRRCAEILPAAAVPLQPADRARGPELQAQRHPPQGAQGRQGLRGEHPILRNI